MPVGIGPALLATAGVVILAAAGALSVGCDPQRPAAPPAAAAGPVPEPSPAPVLPSVALPPELDRVLRDYEAAWAARDAATLAGLFAEDGYVLPNGWPPVQGRAAIRRSYEGHGGPLALRAIAYAVHGGTGFIIGAYAPQAGAADTGKFTLTLRRQDDGRWLIVSDMDNFNRPPR
jgi:ketosteroid isomerase-like protein